MFVKLALVTTAATATATSSYTVRYMLIQRIDDVNESVVLLPAWPCDWDVNFTLTAPQFTFISGSLTNGSLNYTVFPAERASAVRELPCQAPPPPICEVFGCTCQGMSDWYGTDAGAFFVDFYVLSL